MWNVSWNRKEQDHDHSMNNISADITRMNSHNLRGNDQFQVPGSNSVQGWHLLSINQHQDHHSSGSNSQIKLDLVKQLCQLHKQVQIVEMSCHLDPPLWLWDMDPACWLWKKGPDLWDQAPEENFSTCTWSTRPTTGCGDFLAGPQKPLLAVTKGGNWHGLGISLSMTASAKPSLRASWRVVNALDGKGNTGWKNSKSRLPCLH